MNIITKTDELTSFCNRLSGNDFITVDTEFIRETTYWPKLCLIQVASSSESQAIDALSENIDLQPLLDLMGDERIVKVFHAARQDLEIFYLLMGTIPKPIFDTQIAAMVCGFGDSVSYELLVSQLEHKTLDKGSRYTDWARRPLSRRQLDYALADVIYLIPIYSKLIKQLEISRRASWLTEEMAILQTPLTYEPNPYEAYQKIKSRNADRKTMAILRELACWRENKAKFLNIPRNRVIKNEVLLEIAHQAPKKIDELKHTRGLNKNITHGKDATEILSAIDYGLNLPKIEWPVKSPKLKLPRGTGATSELLKVLLKMRCEEHEVASRLVATVSDIELIAGFGEDANVRALKGWRRDIFGNDAIRLRNGDIGLAINNRRVHIFKVTEKKIS